ncbi:MAG: primase-helicase zinc-binding domain-containing protein [Desulfosalsimonas sp.]
MNILDLLKTHTLEYEPKKVSANKGGEWHSSCPGCGGKDRFHVWPEQNDGAGSYWCRQCEKAGDAIQFLMDFEGRSFRDACAALGRDPGKIQPQPMRPPEPKKSAQGAWSPETHQAPAELWREKAEKMVSWCAARLQENSEVLSWLSARGISGKTASAWSLGWNPATRWRPREPWGLEPRYKSSGKKKKLWLPRGMVIPCPDAGGGRVARIRIRIPEPRQDWEPKYYFVPGSHPGPMVLGDVCGEAWIIVESELDAMAIWQAAGDLVTVCGLGSSSARPDAHTAAGLKRALVILDALDYDGAGAKEKKFWSENFRQMERWPVPKGKDPGEACQAGVDLREWILAGLPPRWRVGRSRLDSKRQNQSAACGGGEKSGSADKTASAGKNKSGSYVPGKKRGAEKPADTGKLKNGNEAREKLPQGVIELAEIMKSTPVKIFTRHDRLAIEYPYNWADKNDETLRRISELVYMDPEVFDHINRLPAGRYTGRNLVNV